MAGNESRVIVKDMQHTVGPWARREPGMIQFMVSDLTSRPPGCPVNITFNGKKL